MRPARMCRPRGDVERSETVVSEKMVPPARLELASPKATDFKSAVFTNFTKGADRSHVYQPFH